MTVRVVEVIDGGFDVTTLNRRCRCCYVIRVIDNGVGMRAWSISWSGLDNRRAAIPLPLVAFPLAMARC